MNSKNFEAGQKWRSRNGNVNMVKSAASSLQLTYPVHAVEIAESGEELDSRSFTDEGRYFSGEAESEFDLVELIEPTTAEVQQSAAELVEQEQKTSSELTCAAPKDDQRSLVDSLIFNLAPAFANNHRSGDEMMDFIKTVVDRRKAILA